MKKLLTTDELTLYLKQHGLDTVIGVKELDKVFKFLAKFEEQWGEAQKGTLEIDLPFGWGNLFLSLRKTTEPFWLGEMRIQTTRVELSPDRTLPATDVQMDVVAYFLEGRGELRVYGSESALDEVLESVRCYL